jgi:hypothetical protein
MVVEAQMKETMLRIEELFQAAGDKQTMILDELTKVANALTFLQEVYKLEQIA